MSDDNQEISYTAPVSAPEPGATAATEDVNNESQAGEEQAQEDRTFTQDEYERALQKERAKVERKVRREFEARAQEAQRPSNQPEPTREEYASDVDFFDALIDHRADVKVAHHEQQKQQTAVNTTYAEREEVFSEQYSDFQDVVYKATDEGGPAISQLMAEAIKTSEVGPALGYYLGNNVNESHRIFKLSPIDQVRELTRLEAKLGGNATPPPKKVSSAPDPITPVAGTRASTVKYDVTDPRSDKMSHADWIAARNKSANR